MVSLSNHDGYGLYTRSFDRLRMTTRLFIWLFLITQAKGNQSYFERCHGELVEPSRAWPSARSFDRLRMTTRFVIWLFLLTQAKGKQSYFERCHDELVEPSRAWPLHTILRQAQDDNALCYLAVLANSGNKCQSPLIIASFFALRHPFTCFSKAIA